MTKSSRLRASLPRSTRTPLCELPAGRTRCPSRAFAWYMPTMPCTWHAVNEAMLAMTSLATLTEPRGRSGIGLDPLHVGARAGIDPDDVALVDKERHIQDQPGLHRGRLAAAGRRVAFEAGRRLRDFQVDRGGQLDAQGASLVHQHVERAVLFQVFHGVAQLVVAERQLIVARQVHEIVAGSRRVEGAHGDPFRPRAPGRGPWAGRLVCDEPPPDVGLPGARER